MKLASQKYEEIIPETNFPFIEVKKNRIDCERYFIVKIW